MASGVIFVVLLVTTLPIIRWIRWIPAFKELVLGGLVVVAFTSIVDWKEGAKYALIAGMAAAVLFNVINIPLQIALGSVLSGVFGSAQNSAAQGGILGGLGALSNLIGLVIFSPVGFGVGGAIGAVLNGEI
jgi:hypothetical protein